MADNDGDSDEARVLRPLQALQQLCRCITRPALASERVPTHTIIACA